MNWRQSCIGLIPCFNEEAAIGQVVRGVREFVDRVLVIDDGSTDFTSAAAQVAGAEVARHSEPRGKGAALMTGLTKAVEGGFEWALILDGDGQHAPRDIAKFFQAAQTGSFGLIIGNRMGAKHSMPMVRRWVNQWMSRKLSRLAGHELPDTQCGFRLVRLEGWCRTELRTQHFEIESEMLMEFIRTGQGVGWVPVEVIYKTENSKIHPVRDTVRWFRWLRGRRRAEGRGRRAEDGRLRIGPDE